MKKHLIHALAICIVVVTSMCGCQKDDSSKTDKAAAANAADPAKMKPASTTPGKMGAQPPPP